MIRRVLSGVAAACIFFLGSAFGSWDTHTGTVLHAAPQAKCGGLPGASELQSFLRAAPGMAKPPSPIGGTVGGLFNGALMWAAVVNRDGELCAAATSTDDATQVWPGSQAIAKSKAYTANAFSLDSFSLSTALLYTFTQPGHSLWSLGQSNLFDTAFLAAPGGEPRSAAGSHITGGLIFFGGGVPLYSEGKIIGGLGVSGDTSCADHEVAKRVRDLAGLNPPSGPTADDISYSSTDGASIFTHPLCPNTFRNGVFIGNELPAVGY